MNDTCPLTYPGADTFGVPAIDRQPSSRRGSTASPRSPCHGPWPSAPGAIASPTRMSMPSCASQKLALAGRLAIRLVHDFNNTLLVARACLDLMAEMPGDAGVVRDQARLLRRPGPRVGLARRVATFGRPDDGTGSGWMSTTSSGRARSWRSR